MIAKVPPLFPVNGKTISKDVYDLNVSITNKLRREMLHEIGSKLNEVLFCKAYKYTRTSEYLSRMFESINHNSTIINALDKIRKIDECTFIHSINTSFYSMFIAMCMGLNEQQVINATQAGLLHDIGKIYLPNELLNKRGNLDKEEYEIIKKHTLYGYFLLNEFGDFNLEVRRAVLFHHERIDLSGYSLGACPDYVGVISKIVSVADVYDAMTTDRIYKKGIAPTLAMKFLSTDGMKILDNEVINVFRANMPIGL